MSVVPHLQRFARVTSISTQLINQSQRRWSSTSSDSAASAPTYALPAALRLMSAFCVRPRAEGVEIALNLNVDPRKPNQNVRGVAALPHGTGTVTRVAVFAKGEKAREARDAGAEVVGEMDLVERIQAGDIAFDRCIAAPDCMALVGRVARILGPRGLMPNPKLGTVTNDIAAAVQAAKQGSVEFRSEKAGIVQAGVGKSDFETIKLEQNISALVTAVMAARPSGARGQFLQSAFLHSSYGPSIPLDIRQPPFKVNLLAQTKITDQTNVQTSQQQQAAQ